MKIQNEKIPDPKELEKEIGEFLSKKFGNNVKLISPVVLPQEMVSEKRKKSPKKERKINFDMKPEELIAFLDQYAVKQDAAKAVLATKICTHFKRIRRAESDPDNSGDMVGAIKKIFFQPLAIVSVRLNERPIDQSVINLAVCYFIVNIFLVFGGGCFMVLVDDMDFTTGMSSVIATLMNIGPGFGTIGPSENYAHISDVGKWFLSWNMLVGRLEMFSALVIFYPSFWKR